MAVAGVNRPTALRLPDTDISARRIRHVGRQVGDQRLIAVLLSVALHAVALTLATQYAFRVPKQDAPPPDEPIMVVEFLPVPEVAAPPPQTTPITTPPPGSKLLSMSWKEMPRRLM